MTVVLSRHRRASSPALARQITPSLMHSLTSVRLVNNANDTVSTASHHVPVLPA